MNVNRLALLLFVTLNVLPLAADAAAPVPMSFFCQANAQKSDKFYLTETFSATAEVDDVTKAWQSYIAAEDSKAKAAICQAGVDVASLEDLRKLTLDSVASSPLHVVTVDWKYVART